VYVDELENYTATMLHHLSRRLLLLLLFNALYQISYLEIYRTELCQIFRIGRTVAVGNQSEISFSIPQRKYCYDDQFFGFIQTIGFR